MDEQLNQTRHNLLEGFRRYPYFFDAKIRENYSGISVVMSKYANKPYVSKIVRKNNAGRDVSIDFVKDLDEYFFWFGNAVESDLTDDFVVAQEKTLDALANKFGDRDNIQKGVKLMEKGKNITTIDFVYKRSPVLYLFKVCASRKKQARKLVSIQAGAEYFRRHFWEEYSVVKGNIAYYEGALVEFEAVHDARHSGPVKRPVQKNLRQR